MPAAKPAAKKKDKKSPLEIMPGIISAIAALITALVGIVTVLINAPKKLDASLLTPTIIVITTTPQVVPSATNLLPTLEPTATLMQTPTEISRPSMGGFQACLSPYN